MIARAVMLASVSSSTTCSHAACLTASCGRAADAAGIRDAGARVAAARQVLKDLRGGDPHRRRADDDRRVLVDVALRARAEGGGGDEGELERHPEYRQKLEAGVRRQVRHDVEEVEDGMAEAQQVDEAAPPARGAAVMLAAAEIENPSAVGHELGGPGTPADGGCRAAEHLRKDRVAVDADIVPCT